MTWTARQRTLALVWLVAFACSGGGGERGGGGAPSPNPAPAGGGDDRDASAATEAVAPAGGVAAASRPLAPLRAVDCGQPEVACVYVDAAASGGGDGSAAAPHTTVAAAVAAAPTGGVILVAAGTYPEAIALPDKRLTLLGSYRGRGDWSSRDVRAHPSTLRGTGHAAVITVSEADGHVVEGFEITGGTGFETEWNHRGGGVFCYASKLSLIGNVIRDNAATHEGGGVFTKDCEVELRGNLIANNRGERGAGVAHFGGTAVIAGNTIADNIATGDHGGGVYTAARTELRDNVIRGNSVGRELGWGWGGGVLVFNPSGDALLTGNLIAGNFAPTRGGGVFVDEGGKARLVNELIVGNSTNGEGAGVLVDAGDPGSSVVSIELCTIADNRGNGGDGQGVFVEEKSQVTVADSISTNGGSGELAAYDSSTLTVRYTSSRNQKVPGDGNRTGDCGFIDPGAGDYRLRPGSPCIDGADPATPFDREPQPNGGRANLGAYGNTPRATSSR